MPVTGVQTCALPIYIVEASEAIAEQILITNYILGGEKALDQLEIARFYEIYKENRAKRVKK